MMGKRSKIQKASHQKGGSVILGPGPKELHGLPEHRQRMKVWNWENLENLLKSMENLENLVCFFS